MACKMQNLNLSCKEQALLERFGFDADAFSHLKSELAAGRFPLERNRVTDTIAPPRAEDLHLLPSSGSPQALAYEQAGLDALHAGHVAVAILNGGMATRFGGQVKGTVKISADQSFLALKLRPIATAPGPVPVFLMNSFATSEPTCLHIQELYLQGLQILEDRLHMIHQGIALRLTPEGDFFYDAQGHVSCYAPGHGDLLNALAQAPAFQRFAAQGGRMVMVSNVDNLAATLSARVLGAHLHSGALVTVEVAPRLPGDTGGAPVRRGHAVEVLEGFRFPQDFDLDRLPVFNTNTFVFSTQAVQSGYPLTWFRVDKQVENRPAVQFERLLGEISAFVPCCYLQVPRQGAESRFLPVKTPHDLQKVQPWIQQVLASFL